MLKRGQTKGLVTSCIVTKLSNIKHWRGVRKIRKASQDGVMTQIPIYEVLV